MTDRANQLITDILRRIHEAIVENDITYEEYQAAKQWFIDVGEAGEWPLFGDVYIEHVVEEQAFGNRKGSQGTILGPFHVPDAPLLDAPFELPHRTDEPGDRTHISGRVSDVDGKPLADANLDIWQADSEGRYSGFMPGPPEGNLRGQVRTDADGRYEYITVIPGPYTIPLDGPTGKMTAAAGWSPWRPAHIHLIVSAEGYEPLVTQLFIDSSDYLDSDVASAVKPELIVHPEPARRASTPSPTTSRWPRRARRRSPKPMTPSKSPLSAAESVVWCTRSRSASAASRLERLRAGRRAARDRRRRRALGQRHARAAPARPRRAGRGRVRRAVRAGHPPRDHWRGHRRSSRWADGYEATFGAPYYGVHRVALLQALGDHLGGEGLHLGHRCVGLQERATGVELRFANGATAEADVVVGADGVHSVIRPTSPASPGRYSGTVGYRGLVPVKRCRRCPIRRRCSSGRGLVVTSCTTRSTAAGR